MAVLSNILQGKTSPFVTETNLEKGIVTTFTQSGGLNEGGIQATGNVCYNFPGAGTAVIEVWGAAGSSGKMCCCGAGIPGNPPAYARRTVTVDGATWIRGFVGGSCSNDNLCFKGCSQASCITVCSPNGTLSGPTGNSTCFCICSQGGAGGMTFCNGSSQPFCCFRANGFCFTDYGSSCGMVCNVRFWNPRCAYGGDVNCNSGDPSDVTHNHSKSEFYRCYPCRCTQNDYLGVPPGIIAEEGAQLTYARECYSANTGGTGDGPGQIKLAIAGAGRLSSKIGTTNMQCWNNNRTCGCYESNHCRAHIPPAIPGQGASTASSVRDYGTRGGGGIIRIKFIGA